MIDPQVIIKSQIVNDKIFVDLNEVLEKYGTDSGWTKNITLQFYNQQTGDDDDMIIEIDAESKGAIIPNTTITISKDDSGDVYIRGSLVDNLYDMNFLPFVLIENGEYENGITVINPYEFDIHVIKV